ncbi:MAG: hypothetical protein U0869_01365 [Chloroflexota bacterium]
MTEFPPAPRRVAIRLQGDGAPRFLAAAAAAVLRCEGVEVSLVLVVPRPSVHRSVRARLRGVVTGLFERFERAVLPGGPEALVVSPVPALPDSAAVVRAVSPVAQAAALAEARVDVLIDLVMEDRPDGLPVPPFGRWRLRYANGIDGAREMTLRRPAVAMDLAVSLLTIEHADGTRLEREVGIGAVKRTGYPRDRDAAYWRSTLLPARHLARLVAGTTIDDRLASDEPATTPDRHPRGWAMPVALDLTLGVARKALGRALYRSNWVVLVRDRGPGAGPPTSLEGFRVIRPEPGRFFADPFVLDQGEHVRILVEDCPVGTHRGRISSLRRDAGGSWVMDRVELADLSHRAYPHVVSTPDGVLLTPDGGGQLGVDLFLEDGTDGTFEPFGRCLESHAISDPTVIWHLGRYWLFVAIKEHGMSPWDELHLYSAERLAGPWSAHPQNPVVADVRRARPAGRIFEWNGRLVRPGQDCSRHYGGRIALAALRELTPTTYREEHIGWVEPRGLSNITRTHTYTAGRSVEAVDGFYREPRWRGSSGP